MDHGHFQATATQFRSTIFIRRPNFKFTNVKI